MKKVERNKIKKQILELKKQMIVLQEKLLDEEC